MEKPSSLCGRALLEHQLQQCRIVVAVEEGRNEALASQVRELKEKIRAAETDADRLNKQLLLLQGSLGAAVGAEEKEQQEMQEKLRQLYLEYARRSAVCDTLMASVEDMASRAEAAAAQNRCRLQEARQRLLLEQAAGASASETQTNVSCSASISCFPVVLALAVLTRYTHSPRYCLLRFSFYFLAPFTPLRLAPCLPLRRLRSAPQMGGTDTQVYGICSM